MERLRGTFVGGLIVVLLAGCLGDAEAAEDVTPPAGAPRGASFSPVTAFDCAVSNCYEPAIAVDTQDRIIAVAGFEPLLGISEDGGATFEELPGPPLPAEAPSDARPGDAIVAASPSGRLYYQAFLWPFSVGGLPVSSGLRPPSGLHLAGSPDGGQTWDTNVHLSVIGDPGETVIAPWKNWMGFAPSGEVYSAYAMRPGGIWVARSDDDGASFGPFVHATPPPDFLYNAFIGTPVVLPDGRLLIPHWGDQKPSPPPVGIISPWSVTSHALRVAISDDRGESFRSVTVETWPPTENAGAFFPILTLDGDGALYLAHRTGTFQTDGEIFIRSSTDRGESWSEPILWSGERSSATGAWIAARDGILSLFFVDRETGDLIYSRGPVGAGVIETPTEVGIVAPGVGPSGDFPHFGLLRDGRMATVWSDLEGGVFVAIGP